MMQINYDRLKYSPFGKRIMNGFKAEIILAVCTVPLGVFITAFALMAGSLISAAILALILLGVPTVLVITSVRSTLFEANLLSEMTDEDHNRLIAEYKKYEERNITRYGHLTSYGIILADRILPWKNVKKISFRPGQYRRSGKGGYHYHPATITVTAEFRKKRIVSGLALINEEYDLSGEIEAFLGSIPNYTEYRFAVDNEYYYAK